MLRYDIVRRPAIIVGLLLIAGIGPQSRPAFAQDVRFSFAARNAPLEAALQRFSEATGINVTYQSELTDGILVYCLVEAGLPDDIMQCLLADTGLDYVRLSSGTYAIVRSAALPPRYGALHGRVVSAGSNAPLPYTHVVLADLNQGVTADEAGRFVFPPLLPGTYRVSASHLGYTAWQDTVRIDARLVQTITIPLAPSIHSLEPIVIDALLYRHLSEGLQYMELTAQQLLDDHPSFGAVNVLHHLSAQSGIQFSSSTSDLHIQAGNAGEHQIRLDGSPIFLPQQLGGFWGPFNPLAIEHFRIYKSGFGVKHGSFQAGVVEANHRLTPPQGNHVSVHVAPLTINALAGIEKTFASSDRLNVMAALRHDLWPAYASFDARSGLASWSAPDPFLIEAPLFLGGALQPGDPPVFEHVADAVRPDLSFSDVHTAASYQFTPARRLHASYYRGHLGVDSQGEAADLNIRDAYRWRNAAGQVRFETVLGPRTLVEGQARSSKFTLAHDYQLIDELNVLAGRALTESQSLIERPIDDRNTIVESALSLDVTHAQSSRHQLQAGAVWSQTTSRFQLVASHTLSLVDRVLGDNSDSLEAATRQFHGDDAALQAAVYVEDEWRINNRIAVLPGARWTWLESHAGSYIEPRTALRVTSADGAPLEWQGRFAVGLYHQFITQHDLGTANVGAILPSLRFWLPIPAGRRPPRALHLAANAYLKTPDGWAVRAEAFVRRQPHTLAIKQLPQDDFFASPPSTNPAPAAFMEPARGSATGAALTLEKSLTSMRLSVTGEWNRARRQSASYFGGRSVAPAWVHPFRLAASLHWQPIASLTLKAAWLGIWRRTWAFRQAYYDNLAHLEASSIYPPFDLSRPESHRLPPFLQTDVSASYRREGTLPIQLDAGILNVFARKNAADWRLAFNPNTGQFDVIARKALPGFAPYLRLSVSW